MKSLLIFLVAVAVIAPGCGEGSSQEKSKSSFIPAIKKVAVKTPAEEPAPAEQIPPEEPAAVENVPDETPDPQGFDADIPAPPEVEPKPEDVPPPPEPEDGLLSD